MLDTPACFNPLDWGNLYQITRSQSAPSIILTVMVFQSPRSGKFVSDVHTDIAQWGAVFMFQSPRSGKFVSDTHRTIDIAKWNAKKFQSPRSGKFVSDTANFLSYLK